MKQTIGALSFIMCFCKPKPGNLIEKPYSLIITQIV